jgi:hypothetical protein
MFSFKAHPLPLGFQIVIFFKKTYCFCHANRIVKKDSKIITIFYYIDFIKGKCYFFTGIIVLLAIEISINYELFSVLQKVHGGFL